MLCFKDYADQWRTGQVVSLPMADWPGCQLADGKWTPLDIIQYGPPGRV